MRVRTIGEYYIAAGVEKRNLKGFIHYKIPFMTRKPTRLNSSNVLTLQILNLTK